jgi:hypothetical protein
MKLCKEVLEGFKKSYLNVHPLVMQRSIERATSASDLFEILESIPKNPPFSWSEEKHSWTKDPDVAAKSQMKKIMSKGD